MSVGATLRQQRQHLSFTWREAGQVSARHPLGAGALICPTRQVTGHSRIQRQATLHGMAKGDDNLGSWGRLEHKPAGACGQRREQRLLGGKQREDDHCRTGKRVAQQRSRRDAIHPRQAHIHEDGVRARPSGDDQRLLCAVGLADHLHVHLVAEKGA